MLESAVLVCCGLGRVHSTLAGFVDANDVCFPVVSVILCDVCMCVVSACYEQKLGRKMEMAEMHIRRLVVEQRAMQSRVPSRGPYSYLSEP